MGCHLIRRYNLADGQVSHVLGTGSGFTQGGPKSVAFHNVYSLCADPTKPHNFYVGDGASVRYCDGGITGLVAGSNQAGKTDGVGANARFNGVNDIVTQSTANGKTHKLFVADIDNHVIRVVDPDSGKVSTFAGDGTNESRDGNGLKCAIGYPRCMVWDLSPHVKPETVLWITTYNHLMQLNTETGAATRLPLRTKIPINPWAIQFTPSCHLLVGCRDTHAVYAINLQPVMWTKLLVRVMRGGWTVRCYQPNFDF